ncbi:flagellar export chaperone FliS [Aquifex sp.]
MMIKNPAQTYLQNMVESASPIEHIVMLYNKAISCIEEAIELFDEREDLEKRKEFIYNIDRVYDIVSFLKAFLDIEKGGEIAKNLNQIYATILYTLAKPDKTKEELVKISEILKDLKEAWEDVKRQYNKT